MLFRSMLRSLNASSEKFSGKIMTEEILPSERASFAASLVLNNATLKGSDLEMVLIACVEIRGISKLVSRFTIPILKFDAIFSGSFGAVRLNKEKINAIRTGTIAAALNNLLRRKSFNEEGIKLNQNNLKNT